MDGVHCLGKLENLTNLLTCDLAGDGLRGKVDEAREQRGGVDVQEAFGRETSPADRQQPRVESCHSCRARIHLKLSSDTGLSFVPP